MGYCSSQFDLEEISRKIKNNEPISSAEEDYYYDVMIDVWYDALAEM